MRRKGTRHRTWGFGPAGWALLPVLAFLVWTAATGFDLRHRVQSAICDAFGWWVLYKFTIALSGHYFALWSPQFGPTALCVVFLGLHFAARRPRAWEYALLVVWALAAPAVLWVTPPAWKEAPSWFPGRGGLFPWAEPWVVLLTTLVGCSAAIPMWLATRSHFVAAATVGAVLLLFPLAETQLVLSAIGGIPYHVFVWHAALAVIMGWWVYMQRGDAKPFYACQVCGYDLRGLPAAATCPECARPVAGPVA